MRFLLFTLYAPMGSFGEIAVGERRMSWARPGRSAILGLVAAAQGVERTDETAHQRLEAGLYYAVRTDAPGRPLLDYHTAQTPKARKGQRSRPGSRIPKNNAFCNAFSSSARRVVRSRSITTRRRRRPTPASNAGAIRWPAEHAGSSRIGWNGSSRRKAARHDTAGVSLPRPPQARRFGERACAPATGEDRERRPNPTTGASPCLVSLR